MFQVSRAPIVQVHVPVVEREARVLNAQRGYAVECRQIGVVDGVQAALVDTQVGVGSSDVRARGGKNVLLGAADLLRASVTSESSLMSGITPQIRTNRVRFPALRVLASVPPWR